MFVGGLDLVLSISSLLMAICPSQWPRSLRRRPAAARLLRLWIRIPSGAWLSVVSVVYCRGRGIRDDLITRPVDSYRLWCVVVCDIETSWMRRPCPTGVCRAKKTKTVCLLFMSLPVVQVPRAYITCGCYATLPVESLICVHCLHLSFEGSVKVLFFF